MKKVFWVILSMGMLLGCQCPHGQFTEEPVVEEPLVKEPVVEMPLIITFSDAIQEVYEITGAGIVYSSDGIDVRTDLFNRSTRSTEVMGLCVDYAIEFFYVWNEVKGYGDLFGKAYLAQYSHILTITDIEFADADTYSFRDARYTNSVTEKGYDSVYRDAHNIGVVYSGELVEHYGAKSNAHMAVAILFEGEWYEADPTWWDTSTNGFNYPPMRMEI